MYLTPTENHFACDIEADNLLPDATRIWCVCVENVVSGEKASFVDASGFVAWMTDHPNVVLIGHNFIAYDAVMLNKFWDAKIRISRCVDTLVLSQMYKPTLGGGHSLESWGERLRLKKTSFSDFSKVTPEMLTYCANDTSLTALLFRRLTERMRSVSFSETGCEIEHLAWNIIQNKQKKNGFPFNQKKALELYTLLRNREEELRDEIYKLWPPRLECVGEYTKAIKKDGTPSSNYTRHREQYPKLDLCDDGSYRVFDYVEFNLGSPAQRIEKLLSLGWKPVTFTPKTEKGGGGNPQVDEDQLLAFAEVCGKNEVKLLAKWVVTNSRANMINTWLNAYDEKTHAIHGRLFIASTLRYRHSGPNSANIPAVRDRKVDGKDVILYGEEGAWTYECRDLWWAGEDEGWSLVGIDGTGIQNRILVNYLIKTIGEEAVADFKALSLSGDIHKHNIEVLGLANKAAAKKAYYTLMMGGGGGRLAADQMQFGTFLSEKEGVVLKNKIIDNIPGFHDLIKELKKELNQTGRIKLCDGTPIIVPSPHMVIPYLLQGDESRIMKKAMILVDEEIRRHKIQDHVRKVADIHDEQQYRVKKEVVDEFIALALPCFKRVGESFNYNVPIAAEAKVGPTWACTH